MSLNLITTAEHAYAEAARELVAAWKFVRTAVLPALKKMEAGAPVIEGVTGLVDHRAENIERAAFAVLGLVIKAIEDGDTASEQWGVSVQLDAALVLDIKAITAAVRAQVAKGR
jgi:hypothetical protein